MSIRLRLALIPLALLALALTLHERAPVRADAPPLIVSVIDVGQGDAILVEFPNGDDMLIDAGDKAHGAAVVRYLKERKIEDIDILVATHGDADHIGGMLEVMQAFKVGRAWDSGYVKGTDTETAVIAKMKQAPAYGQPRAGFVREVGAAKIEVLAPRAELLHGNDLANDNSLVMRVTYGTTSVLLTGDIEEKGRARVPAWPTATVLKVSHHGSRNGTDAALLRAVAPLYAAISYGAGNRYGHPHEETLRLLADFRVTLHRTADDGTIVYSADGQRVGVMTIKGNNNAPGGGGGAAAPTGDGGNAGGGGAAYIGNKNSKIFHLPTCGSLPAEANRVYFTTRQEALDAGYKPCGRCKP